MPETDPLDLLYHSSRRRIRPGTRLMPRRSSFVNSAIPTVRKTEQILEQARPKDALARKKSVFMTRSADPFTAKRVGGITEHLYEVRPEGRVERNHVGWWSLINTNCMWESAAAACQEWAQAYWSGDECPDEISYQHDGMPGDWEYRAAAFEIHAETVYLRPIDDGFVTLSGDCFRITVPVGSHLDSVLSDFGLPGMVFDNKTTFLAHTNRRNMLALEQLLMPDQTPAPAF